MKAKTIKLVLRNKINDWLKSIEDEPVRGLLADNIIITGGSIASMLLKEKVNDFDVYFKTREAAIAAAEYYCERFTPKARNGIPCKITIDTTDHTRVRVIIKSAGIASEEGSEKPYQYFENAPGASEYVSDVMEGTTTSSVETTDLNDDIETGAQENEDPSYKPVFMSTNAITLSNRIQLIIRFFGRPEEIHENYDFVHCTNYWTSWDNELYLNQAALESLLSRELRYAGSKYPLCSVVRLRKFIARGWTINASQILKMIMQLNALNLLDHNVLQDQLVGVDAAYFVEVITKLKSNDPAKVNGAYLIEIIDRMF